MNNKINQSLRMVRQIRSNFFSRCTNSYIRKKVTSRCPLDASTGRSMVEMLGVLAIIGVLSVGAIAGYGKAMMKYKLNQHAVAVNMLINNILAIKDKLQHNESGITDYATLLNKLNLLPDGIIQVNDHYLRDKYFNNQIRVFYVLTPDHELNSTYFQIGKSESDHTLEICYNILKVVKENAANLYFVRTYKVYTDDSGHPSDNLYTFYGDGYCTGNRDCLRNLNINKLEQACQTCKEGICVIRIFYK